MPAFTLGVRSHDWLARLLVKYHVDIDDTRRRLFY